jgi:hypothetical protein
LTNIEKEPMDWSLVFPPTPLLLFLYTLSAFVHFLKDQTYQDKFIRQGGPEYLLTLIFHDILQTVTIESDCALIIGIAHKLLKKIDDETNKKRIIKAVGSQAVDQIIQLATKYNDSIGLFIMILGEFGKSRPKYLHRSIPFQSFLERGIFHTQQTIRSSVLSLLKIIGTLKFRAILIRMLNDVPRHCCKEYFSIVEDLSRSLEDIPELFNPIQQTIYKRFRPPESSNIADCLLFPYPSDEFANGIFSVVQILITRLENIVPDDVTFFDVIVHNICYSSFTYYLSSPSVFAVVSSMLLANPSLYDILLSQARLAIDSQDPSYDGTFSTTRAHRGLRNLGATCYMNATLQILNAIPIVRQLFLERMFPETEWLMKLQILIAKLFFFPSDVIDPESFVRCFMWYDEPVNPREQQDASEFVQM